jgi:hypothetical protein
MRFIEVDKVQAGDGVVINNVLHTVDYVEPNGISYDMQLHNPTGEKIQKSFCAQDILYINM